MSKEKIPMKIVVPIIVVTWILSLISALAIVYMMPSLFPVKSEQIGAGLITSDKIADEAIITVKLADGNVTSAKILDGNITAVDIADGSIITIKVADRSITTAKIADGNVTEDKIAANAIVTVKLKDGSVNSAKILDGSVEAVDLKNGSIITAKIADGQVTTQKIADKAVTKEKIADYAVTSLKLAVGAIPYNVSHAATIVGTNSTSYIDMPDMSVSITLTRNSTLIIMFSGQVGFLGPGPYGYWMQALVNGAPTAAVLLTTSGLVLDTRSYTFYGPACVVIPGSYTIKIQYATFNASTSVGAVDRTLTVIALPT